MVYTVLGSWFLSERLKNRTQLQESRLSIKKGMHAKAEEALCQCMEMETIAVRESPMGAEMGFEKILSYMGIGL